MYRRMARVLHIYTVVRERGKVSGMRSLAGGGQPLELVQNMLSRMRNDPISAHNQSLNTSDGVQ